VVKQLKHNQQILNSTNCEIIQQDAILFLQSKTTKYDVIFLDPPYNSDLLQQSLIHIHELLNVDGVCYIEYEQTPNLENYTILKQGKAGKVHFALICLPIDLK
jgi:16S rRNA (guanine966-N2)-methyltransferase